MFSYFTGYYVSPPVDQYLKFKNRCSLLYGDSIVLFTNSADQDCTLSHMYVQESLYSVRSSPRISFRWRISQSLIYGVHRCPNQTFSSFLSTTCSHSVLPQQINRFTVTLTPLPPSSVRQLITPIAILIILITF